MENSSLVIGGFLLEAAMFIIGLANIYTKMEVRFRELELRIQNVEQQDEEIYRKLDLISDKLSEIKLELKDKANRSS